MKRASGPLFLASLLSCAAGAMCGESAVAAVGRTPGSFAVSQTGAATYSIPIWVPPGPHGLQPAISLSYDSRARRGALGPGWSVAGLSAITRCAHTYAQDANAPAPVTLTYSDAFCLDGQRLRLTPPGNSLSTYGQAGTTYQTERESFSQITANGTAGNGPASFTVRGKDGLTYEYGAADNALVMAAGTSTALAWMLNKVTDRAGNTMVVRYRAPDANLTGSTDPASIEWTPVAHGSSTYTYQIAFNYSTNTQAGSTNGFVAGTVVHNGDLLTSIDVNRGATQLRHYALTYEVAPVSSDYRLIQVMECVASDCLLPTTIQYQNGQVGIANPAISVGGTPTFGSARAVDIDGDGREDLVYPVTSGTTQNWYVQFSNGSGFGTPTFTGLTTTTSDDVMLDDFLGKGTTDFLASVTGIWMFYHWNGSGWTVTNAGIGTDSTTLVGNVPTDGRAPSCASADIDGDGLPDLVWAANHNGVRGIYARLNTRTGTTLTFGPQMLAYTFPNSNSFAGIYGNNQLPGTNVRHIDFDGDHRDDIVYMTWSTNQIGSILGQWNELLARGTTFVAGTTLGNQWGGASVLDWNNDSCTDLYYRGTIAISACNGVPGGSINTSAGGFALDWDGDGLTDMVTLGSSSTWYRSVGSDVAAGVPSGLQGVSSSTCLVIDINGDGLHDLVCQDFNTLATTFGLHNGTGTPTDLVTSITDGYGNSASFNYAPLTSSSYTKGSGATFPEKDIVPPAMVVSQATSTDGIGGTYTQTHTYTGARTHLQGREFEGFLTHSVSDSRSSAFAVTSTYLTTFPFTGLVSSRDTYQHNGSTLVSHAGYAYSTTDLDTAAANKRTFVFEQSSTLQSYEVGGPLNGALIATVATSSTYDNYGNATNVVSTATDNDTTSPYLNLQWSSTTATTISADTTNWCLTQPSQISVTRTAPGASAVTRTATYLPDYVSCRPTQRVTAPSTAYEVTEAFGYDAFGNVNADTVTGTAMAARITSTDWGTTGQFPMSVTNPLSEVALFGYDVNLGVRNSATDANGIMTSWLFDAFGRATRENRPDGTSTVWSYSDCASSACLVGSHALVRWATLYNSDSSVQTDGSTYYDTLDRAFLENQRLLASGSYNRREVRYDAFGRVVQEAMPCTWAAITTACPYWKTNTYDALGRVIQVQRPVSATNGTMQTTSFAYAGRSSTRTDPQGKTSTRTFTIAGALAKIRDHDGYTLTSVYDGFGSLLSVSDSLSHTLFTANYDYGIGAFQREVVDADLDLSPASGQHRQYNYDALGELTSWSDAKGQSFSQTYDALSRPRVRTEPDLTTTFTWGNSAASFNIGKLQSVAAGSYTENYGYDNQGRLKSGVISIPSDLSYTYDYGYSATTGLLDTLTYPTSTSSYRLKLKYSYQNGILQSVSDFNAPSTVFWTSNGTNARGQITQETLGNGVVTHRAFDAVTGLASSLQSGVGGGAALQNESYLYDLNGNVTQRQNNNLTLTESFYYDDVYRLDHSTLGGTTNLSLTYDAMGNIASRSDVASGASWTYSPTRLHAVTQAGATTSAYSYDANGNAVTRNGLNISWTSFNHPFLINGINQYDAAAESVQFDYTPYHERWRVLYSGSAGLETTYLIGDRLEKVIQTGTTDYRHYVYVGNAKVAVYSRTLAGVNTLRYLLQDHQGSVAAILGSDGSSYAKESFTAFGNRRSACTWSGKPTAGNVNRITAVTRHGYTWQSALGGMGLNDMNGRIQDAITGRFLSPDPYVQDRAFTQSYNRYSYTLNNPLTFTDPTGFDIGGESPGNNYFDRFGEPVVGGRAGEGGHGCRNNGGIHCPKIKKPTPIPPTEPPVTPDPTPPTTPNPPPPTTPAPPDVPSTVVPSPRIPHGAPYTVDGPIVTKDGQTWYMFTADDDWSFDRGVAQSYDGDDASKAFLAPENAVRSDVQAGTTDTRRISVSDKGHVQLGAPKDYSPPARPRAPEASPEPRPQVPEPELMPPPPIDIPEPQIEIRF